MAVCAGAARHHHAAGAGALEREGVGFRTEPVHRSQLGSFRAAALMNSVTAARPLASIDHVAFAETQRFIELLWRAYERSDLQAV